VLGLILGPIAEVNLRRSLQISGGDLGVFVENPLTITIFVLSLVSVAYPLIQRIRERRAHG